MKKIALIFLSVFFLTSPLYGQENCAAEKKDEFSSLLEELKTVDVDTAREARNAFGIVASFETFDDKEPRCAHIDRLLQQMREHIELYK